MHLITSPNLDAPDDFYQALIDAHQGLTVEQSQALNARLVLVLANHVGRFEVLRQALATAAAAAPQQRAADGSQPPPP